MTKLGRPDLATEAMGIYQGDVYVLLNPREQWTSGHDEGAAHRRAWPRRCRDCPGRRPSTSRSRWPCASTRSSPASKADVAVKIFGADAARARAARRAGAPRAVDVPRRGRRADGGPLRRRASSRSTVDREALARYGLNVDRRARDRGDRHRRPPGHRDDRRRAPLRGRPALPEPCRTDARRIARRARSSRPAASACRWARSPASTVARGPEVINHENGERRIVVQSNVRGRDLGSFVAEAQRRIDGRVPLPTGYYIDWGGQFENQERAMRRLDDRGPAVARDHLRPALRHLPAPPPGGARPPQRAVRAGRRHRRALAARPQPQPLGVGRLHRALRRRRAERRRAGRLHQPPARDRRPPARSRSWPARALGSGPC